MPTTFQLFFSVSCFCESWEQGHTSSVQYAFTHGECFFECSAVLNIFACVSSVLIHCLISVHEQFVGYILSIIRKQCLHIVYYVPVHSLMLFRCLFFSDEHGS